MVRIFALAFVLVVAAWTPAHAQEQTERQRLAHEVMQSMEMERVLSEFFATMAPVVASGMANEIRLTPVQTARLSVIVAEEFGAETATMVGRMVDVYAERMTEEQLRETVAFLRSPSGAAFLQTQTDAQAELERIGQEGGMRVGVRAITRLMQENEAPPPRL